MPRTRTTWTKGQGGRLHGVKNKFPRTARAAVKGLLERFAGDVSLIEVTLRRGLEARPPSSFPYLKLVVEQELGQPEQTINLAEALKRKVIHELHPGPTKAA